MDPISILFSSFLTGMTADIHGQVQDIMGTEVQYRVVEYQAHKIDYQYQIWKIKDTSVCARVKNHNLSDYSSCTVSAKGLFADTCSYLQSHPEYNGKHTKLKNMYCVAAANFKPTIAQISQPSKAESELWDVKQKCSLLTLNARSSGSNAVAKERDIACAEYNKIRN